MPGYRQILSETKEEEYTIENEKIYQQCYERKQLNKNLHNVQVHKSDMSSEIMQDIMPINVNELSNNGGSAIDD